MHTHTTRVLLTAAIALTAALAGCSVNVGDIDVSGWGGGGGQGAFAVRQSYGGKNALAGYGGLRLGRLTDATDGQLPGAFAGYFAAELRDEIGDAHLNAADGRPLEVRVAFTAYNHEAAARVELVDPATGQVLGAADCAGAAAERDPDKAARKRADGLAEAVIDWLKPGFPERDEDD